MKAASPAWARRLPPGWEARRIRTVVNVSNSNVDKKSEEGERLVRLCNYTDVYYNEYITDDFDLMEATATGDEIRRFELRSGDVLITKDSETWDDIAVPACSRDSLPGVVCGYHLTVLRPHARLLHGPFLLRCLQAMGIREQFWLAANGVTRFGLGQLGIKDSVVPVPSLERQRAIANFLDEKTGAIDALIEKKERLIALLAEKRAALIHQAVTKGLDPTVPMKPSGIPWIGDIPAHWEMHRLRRVVRKFVDYRGRTPEKTDEGMPLITAGAVRDGEVDHARSPEYVSEDTYRHLIKRGRPEVGDLLFTSEAPLGEVGLIEDPNVACAQRIIMFKVERRRMSPEFLRLHFLAGSGQGELASRASGSTAEGIRADRLKMSLVPTPPLEEQAAVASHVREETRGFGVLTAKIQAQIGGLSEYRQALITAAVTGQLDIRGAAA